jgi:lipoate---protein ligase
MKWCDLTLASPEENLACDEALLELCEAGRETELLRFWESEKHFVVVGYANRLESEVNLAFCRENSMPVLRRCTGGGAVVQGPGCLNYSLILSASRFESRQGITATNDLVMDRHRAALATLLHKDVQRQGHTDLAIDGLKFSGNAQRRKKNFLLFHGSFLLNFDLGLIGKALPMPSRQPEYRANRAHTEFLRNLKCPPEVLQDVLRRTWEANESTTAIPHEAIRRLTVEKYCLDEWNHKF